MALPLNRTMYPPPLFTACSKRLDYTNSEAPTGSSKCTIYLPGTAACSKAFRGELTGCGAPAGSTPWPPDSHPLMDACQPDKAASHVPQHSKASPTIPKVHAQHL